MEAAGTSACLAMKAVLLSARWAGRSRRRGLEQASKAAADGAECQAENVVLRDTVEFLTERLACAERRLKAANIRKPYSPAERLHTLWAIEHCGITRRQIPKRFGVARSTVWRWLRRLQDGVGLCGKKRRGRVRRTSEELARLVWEVHESNAEWGRRRLALVLGTLGILPAASTVRNILLRPRPRPEGTPAEVAGKPDQKHSRQIVARHPSHVWSADRTRALRWGLWPISVLVAIDHVSRRVVACCPLECPNAGWVAGAMEEAFAQHGAPRHLISDQEEVLISDAFQELLLPWDVKQRFGAVGKHGSIAVNERVILTLKYEWLKRMPVIHGLDHLSRLLQGFEIHYNEYRRHATLGGAVPSVVHRGEQWVKPGKSAKAVPATIERRLFPDTQITAYRLAA